ncbi:MAG: DUF1698 domain-containing protein, partial [Dehalococcoidia bacterium]
MTTLAEKVAAVPFWYHKIALPGGITTPGWAPLDADKYKIPDDLTGKRVLDIGAWDGYWTWEALKRGAKEVVAIDDFSDNLGSLTKEQRPRWETFDLCAEAFGYKVDLTTAVTMGRIYTNTDTAQLVQRIEMSIYDIEKLGKFDVVFFFGTVYHLKHPLLALEKIAAVCDGEIYIESAICDDFSPYQGGFSNKYKSGDIVMEFYPYAEYGSNENNWWAPTLMCLAAMTEQVGFKNVMAWRLTDTPRSLAECRGYVCATKQVGENQKEYPIRVSRPPKSKVHAVMSVPRLGFQDNMFCVFESLLGLRIPLFKIQGVFWGQCMERALCKEVDDGADYILTIDYDTVFKKDDVIELIRLMDNHPEADVLIPMHVGRNGMLPLLTMKGKSGQKREQIPYNTFDQEITKICTGHFGLTLIRVSSLIKMPHPWFVETPGVNGLWGAGKIDSDISFWVNMEKMGLSPYSAN